MSARLAYAYEDFARVCRRLNVVSRLIVAQEAIEDGDPDEARCVLADLECEVVRATAQCEELEEAA